MPLDVIISQSSPTLPPQTHRSPRGQDSAGASMCRRCRPGRGLHMGGETHTPALAIWPNDLIRVRSRKVLRRFSRDWVGIERKWEESAITARLHAGGCSRQCVNLRQAGGFRHGRAGRSSEGGGSLADARQERFCTPVTQWWCW